MMYKTTSKINQIRTCHYGIIPEKLLIIVLFYNLVLEMKLFYQIFLWAYPLAARILSFFNGKAKKWISGRTEIFTSIEQAIRENKRPVIWMHCASLGEFEQGRPLLEALKMSYPGHFILLSFFSPSGYEVQKNYEGANHICYLPMDGAKNAKQFYNIVRPCLVLFVKYEFWYYYSLEAANRKIPMLLVSGIFRESQVFFQFYGGFYRKLLSHFSHLFVQEQNSLDLLLKIGLGKKSSISGDTRFDRVISIVQQFEPIPAIEHFCKGKNVLVAGSTWAEDDAELNHFLHSNATILAIIAPHEIIEERLEQCLKWYPNALLFSTYLQQLLEGNAPEDAQVLIIDNYGMLTRLYYYATLCLVGGGFGGLGVHNVLEAAVYGKPVLIGPIYDKYLEAVDLVENGGCISVENALELEAKMVELLLEDSSVYLDASKATKDYVYSKAGATNCIIDYIQANRLLTN